MAGKLLRAAILLLLLSSSVNAQVQDTINKKTPLLVGKDALLLGVFALGAAAVAPIDMQIANRLQDPGTQENRFLKTSATGFRLLGDPGSVVAGLGVYVVGRIDGQRRVQALGLHSMEFASTLTRETQFWWPHSAFWIGTVFYGGAGLVGASRIYNNMHWASDVMAGAAIGTIIGLKVVKYTHSHPGNQIDDKLIKGKQRSQIQINLVLYSIQF